MDVASLSLCIILTIAQPALADDKDKLFGTWKIVSAVVEDVQTKEQKPLYGEHPRGYLILLPTGRMIQQGRNGGGLGRRLGYRHQVEWRQERSGFKIHSAGRF